MAEEREKRHFSAAEVVAYLKKRQAEKGSTYSQNPDTGLKTVNKMDGDRRFLAEIAETPEMAQELVKIYEAATETFNEKQERLWPDEPYMAALNATVEIINNRILGIGTLKPDEILTNKKFTFRADFVDSTDASAPEKWRLYIDNYFRPPYNRRVAIRNLSRYESKRLGHYTYINENRTNYDHGISLLAGNDLQIYNRKQDIEDWDYLYTSPNSPEMKDKYIDTMRLYLDKCLNSADKVKLIKWKSPQLKKRIKSKQ